jgi:hypothetical protein
VRKKNVVQGINEGKESTPLCMPHQDNDQTTQEFPASNSGSPDDG